MITRAEFALDVVATLPPITTKSTEGGTYDTGNTEQYTEPGSDMIIFATTSDLDMLKVTLFIAGAGFF